MVEGAVGKGNWNKDLQVVVRSSQGQITPDASVIREQKTPGKKRGRPLKGMERLLPPEKKEEKPKEPVKGSFERP